MFAQESLSVVTNETNETNGTNHIDTINETKGDSCTLAWAKKIKFWNFFSAIARHVQGGKESPKTIFKFIDP